ncbi:MAG: hypothetical protein ACI3ZW_07510, partial [Parabacteroides sp.]
RQSQKRSRQDATSLTAFLTGNVKCMFSGVFPPSKNSYIKINAYLRNDIRLVHVRLAKAYGHFKMEIGESTRVVFSHFYIYALHI